jgi:hypothetical protein
MLDAVEEDLLLRRHRGERFVDEKDCDHALLVEFGAGRGQFLIFLQIHDPGLCWLKIEVPWGRRAVICRPPLFEGPKSQERNAEGPDQNQTLNKKYF